MKTAFPITKDAEGTEFSNLEELQQLLKPEPNGQYLLGSNTHWHSGIHISDACAPWCIDKQPIRAIADGKVVAYRMNSEPLISRLHDGIENKEFVYSNNFCLIEHQYSATNNAEGPDNGKINQLKFYSLYMHLAPQSNADVDDKTYKIKSGKSRPARANFIECSYEPDNGYVDLPANCKFKKLSDTKKVSKYEGSGTSSFTKIKITSGGASRTCTDSKLANQIVDATNGKEVWIYWKDSYIEEVDAAEQIYKIKSGSTRRARTSFISIPYYEPNKGYVELPVGCQFKKLADTKVVTKDGRTSTVNFTKIKIISGGASKTWTDSKLANQVVDATDNKEVWIFWVSGDIEEEESLDISWVPEPSDSVKILASPIVMEAGDPIGFLGKYEAPLPIQDESRLITSIASQAQHMMHLEVFTQDEDNLKNFLENKAGIVGQDIQSFIPAGQALYAVSTKRTGKVNCNLIGRGEPVYNAAEAALKSSDTTLFTLKKDGIFEYQITDERSVFFGDTSLKAVKGKVIEGVKLDNSGANGLSAWFCIDSEFVEVFPTYEATVPASTLIEEHRIEGEPNWIKDGEGKEWLAIGDHFVPKEAMMQASEYDLIRQGYCQTVLEGDSYRKPNEPPQLFQQLFNAMDSDHNNVLSEEELEVASQDPNTQTQLQKMIVKMHSDWHQIPGDISRGANSYYSSFMDSPVPLMQNLAQHEMDRVEGMEWMYQAKEAGLTLGPKVWHMWPCFCFNVFSRPSTSRSVAPGTGEMSVEGLEALAKWEGAVKENGKHVVYDDATGGTISSFIEGATIGYGHLIKTRREFNRYENGIDDLVAISLLKEDVSSAQNKVNNTISVSIKQIEFDACVALAFNIGNGAFASSSVLKLINNPNAATSYDSLEGAWKAWNKGTVNGERIVINGLINRRSYEWVYYTTGNY